MTATDWSILPLTLNAVPGAALGALLGLAMGSFLSTLVVRWPQGRRAGGRSSCDSCGVQLRAQDLVPLVSWLQLKGRCSACDARIDPVHPAMELCGAAIGALALLAAPGLEGLAGALLGWILMTLIVLDLRHFWLPDRLTLPLLGLGLLLGPGNFPERALAALIGGGVLLALALGYRAVRGRDGLGLGDVKLMAALGAWLSPALLPPLMLAAALIGLGFAWMQHRRGLAAEDGRVPFGACLALAGFPLWLVSVATNGG